MKTPGSDEDASTVPVVVSQITESHNIVIKRSLSEVESMEFLKEPKENYDPHHIIFLRKQANKNKPFEHQFIEGLNETANLLQTPGSGGDARTLPVTVSQV